MEKKVRLFMTVSKEELEAFETARESLGMNRSQYLRYLVRGQREIRPPAVKERELIRYLAEVERDLKVIAMKENLSDGDRLLLMEKLDDLKTKLMS